MKIKLLLFSFLITLLIFNLGISWNSKSDNSQKEKMKEEILFWKKIAVRQKNYPDAWVELALGWHQLGKDKWARLSIIKARKMDPVRPEIKAVADQLLKNN